MGKVITIFIFAILIIGCKRLEYKYHIVGKVNTETGLRDAQWYTDTICFDNDTIFYKNSDSSIVKIYPPYEVYEITN